MVEEIDDGGTQTGDRVNYWLWIIGLGCSVLVFVIVIIAKAQKDETAKGGTAQ